MNPVTADVLIVSTLELAVPLAIDRMRARDAETRAAVAHAAADVIAAHGDALLFKARPGDTAGRRHTRDAFAALARGLAAGAYQPGGIDFAGRHWCVDHQACVAAATEVGR